MSAYPNKKKKIIDVFFDNYVLATEITYPSFHNNK